MFLLIVRMRSAEYFGIKGGKILFDHNIILLYFLFEVFYYMREFF